MSPAIDLCCDVSGAFCIPRNGTSACKTFSPADSTDLYAIMVASAGKMTLTQTAQYPVGLSVNWYSPNFATLTKSIALQASDYQSFGSGGVEFCVNPSAFTTGGITKIQFANFTGQTITFPATLTASSPSNCVDLSGVLVGSLPSSVPSVPKPALAGFGVALALLGAVVVVGTRSRAKAA